jgi:transposase
MEDSISYIGLDVHAASISVAIARSGRDAPEYFGKLATSAAAVDKLLGRLEADGTALKFCYEAGPTGYALYRQIVKHGHECLVAAPSMIARKPGNRVKNDRRDAIMLASQLRAGDLTPVWIGDAPHEAMRDLIRARDAATRARKRVRQQTASFMLRQGRTYDRQHWTARYRQWLLAQRFDHEAQRVMMSELILEIDATERRVARIESEIERLLPEWDLAPVVAALQCLKGVRLVTAAALAAELGDLRRFSTARALMAYVGLTPSEHSSGYTVRYGGITKAGSTWARTAAVEAAWNYRFPARISNKLDQRTRDLPDAVKEIGVKAQRRLCGRYRHLTVVARKPTPVVITAIARELLGFVWAIGREVTPVM